MFQSEGDLSIWWIKWIIAHRCENRVGRRVANGPINDNRDAARAHKFKKQNKKTNQKQSQNNNQKQEQQQKRNAQMIFGVSRS